MKTTEKTSRKRKAAPTHLRRAKHTPQQAHHEHEQQEEPEEGAGNNDERELPTELRNDAPTVPADKRPPTNAVPDRPQDPSTPAYKEPPNPHDRIVNN